ncbi:flagellar protein FlhE [Entomohabitans teleogrylli]|uniref:flagellar protein FlhE n=1 Tax=Entomohabitans teleogrylli TaxID=1384589 RepID=UPI0008FC586E|nr:flagellar protein FlhE [Entomohabitans teleogrylli]
MPLLLILLAMWAGNASAGGQAMWTASAVGPVVAQRGVRVLSPLLKPREKVSGSITLVAWRYSSSAPMPVAGEVKLCAAGRCIALDGASGATRELAGAEAGEPLRLVWYLPGAGRLVKPWRITGIQVIVNYAPRPELAASGLWRDGKERYGRK